MHNLMRVYMKNKLLIIVIWVLRILLLLVFVLAGSGKFSNSSYMADNFIRWNLGVYFMNLVGSFEILGGVFLLFQKTIFYGCLMLLTIMLGAFVIHFIHFDELGFPLLNLTLIACISLLYYLSRSLKS